MKLTKGDKVLVVLLLVFSIVFAYTMSNFNKNHDELYVSIQINGEEINTIKFSDDIIGQTYEIETEFGTNVLEFGKNEIKIIEASCLDKLCIKQGTISQAGELLVCLPNRLVIEIKSDSGSNQNIDNFAF